MNHYRLHSTMQYARHQTGRDTKRKGPKTVGTPTKPIFTGSEKKTFIYRLLLNAMAPDCASKFHMAKE